LTYYLTAILLIGKQQGLMYLQIFEIQQMLLLLTRIDKCVAAHADHYGTFRRVV